MNFAGMQKLTLLDYPEKTACTVFTNGCNLRCPFCHNAGLVLPEMMRSSYITAEELMNFLQKRVGLLDGVCISGGEPLLHYKELRELIPRIRELGYLVKLDTNGTDPSALSELVREKLLDYVAMDVKNAFPHYPETVGTADFDVTPIKKSIEILLCGAVDYEFRTTVVKGLHTPERIRTLAQSISGAKRYFLQCFRDSGELIRRGLSAPSNAELQLMKESANQFCPTEIRG